MRYVWLLLFFTLIWTKLGQTTDQTVSYDHVYALEIDLPVAGDITIETTAENQIQIKTSPVYPKSQTDEGEFNPSTVEEVASPPLVINRLEDIVQLSLPIEGQPARLDLQIQTPPDLSIRINATDGDIRLRGIRGNLDLYSHRGDIELQQTTGRYKVALDEGRISGQILLNGGQNQFVTKLGSVSIEVLDYLAAETKIEAPNGDIALDLPDGFEAVFEVWKGERLTQSFVSGEGERLILLRTGEGGKVKLSGVSFSTNATRSSRPRSEDLPPAFDPWRPGLGLKFKPAPVIDFNRVHGLVLGGKTTLHQEKTPQRQYMLSLSLSPIRLINQGFSSQRLDYLAGIKQTWQQGKKSASSLTAGLTVYRLTDIISSVGQIVFQEPLGASIWGTANLDYYQRVGGQVWLKQQVNSALTIDLTLTDEQQKNLFKYTDWSLLAKNQPKRGNQRIRAGNLQSAKLSLSLDSRPEKLTRSRFFRDLQMPSPKLTVGWLGKLSVDLARQSIIEMEESLGVSEFHLQLTRYNRFGKNHAFNIRGHAGMLTGADYLPQRLFYLGGFSLRGFSSREFIGDRLFLFNLEYVYLHPTGILGAVFSDSGCAWYQSDQSLPWFGLSLGLGAGFYTPEGQLRFEVTMPQTGSSDGRQPHLALRLGQAF